jgi:hypothetical protein
MESSGECGWPSKEFQNAIHGVAAGITLFPEKKTGKLYFIVLANNSIL